MNNVFGFSMFSFINILFPAVFLLVFGVIIFTIVKSIKEWSSNNKQPVLSVAATLVAKRVNVSRHGHNTANHHHHSSTNTTYYLTFQVESGDRMEFRVAGKEYGILAEGDIGKLTFQGSRYHSFERMD